MSVSALPIGCTNTVKATSASPSMATSPRRPQSAYTPIGDTKSSEAMTPESLATARRGTFSICGGRIRARQVRSYQAGDLPQYGGSEGGDANGCEQPATA